MLPQQLASTEENNANPAESKPANPVAAVKPKAATKGAYDFDAAKADLVRTEADHEAAKLKLLDLEATERRLSNGVVLTRNSGGSKSGSIKATAPKSARDAYVKAKRDADYMRVMVGESFEKRLDPARRKMEAAAFARISGDPAASPLLRAIAEHEVFTFENKGIARNDAADNRMAARVKEESEKAVLATDPTALPNEVGEAGRTAWAYARSRVKDGSPLPLSELNNEITRNIRDIRAREIARLFNETRNEKTQNDPSLMPEWYDKKKVGLAEKSLAGKDVTAADMQGFIDDTKKAQEEIAAERERIGVEADKKRIAEESELARINAMPIEAAPRAAEFKPVSVAAKPAHPVSLLASAIDKKSRFPVLQYAMSDGKRMITTDLDVSVSVPTSKPKGLYAINEKSKDITKTSEDASEFPAAPAIDMKAANARSIEVGDIGAFRSAMAAVVDAASEDPARRVINGIGLSVSDGTGEVAGTDGRRLHYSLFAIDKKAGDFPEPGKGGAIPIPRRAAEVIIRSGMTGAGTIRLDDRYMEVESGGAVIRAKLNDGVYPNYRQVVPSSQDQPHLIAVNRSDLGQAIKDILPSVTADPDNKAGYNSVDVMIVGNRLTIQTGEGRRQFRRSVDVPVQWEKSGKHKIAFAKVSGPFLYDLIRSVRGEKIKIGMSDDLSPIKVEDAAGQHTSVLMPLRPDDSAAMRRRLEDEEKAAASPRPAAAPTSPQVPAVRTAKQPTATPTPRPATPPANATPAQHMAHGLKAAAAALADAATAVEESGKAEAGKQSGTSEGKEEWADFTPNDAGYMTREVAGLPDRYFVAQHSPTRAEVIESGTSNVLAIVKKQDDGWHLFTQGNVVQIGDDSAGNMFGDMHDTGKVYQTPSEAVLDVPRAVPENQHLNPSESADKNTSRATPPAPASDAGAVGDAASLKDAPPVASADIRRYLEDQGVPHELRDQASQEIADGLQELSGLSARSYFADHAPAGTGTVPGNADAILDTGRGNDALRNTSGSDDARAIRAAQVLVGHERRPEKWSNAFSGAPGGVISTLLRNYIQRTMPVLQLRGIKIENAQDFAALLMPLRSPWFETLKVAYLDENRHVLDFQVLTVGLVNSSQAHAAVVMRDIPPGTRSVLLSHNHPSGETEPSPQDIDCTRGIEVAMRAVGLQLTDHVITNGGKFTSLRNLGIVSALEPAQSRQDASTLKPHEQRGREAIPPMIDRAAWEAVRRDGLEHIGSATELEEFLRVMRQSANQDGNPHVGHVLFLSPRHHVLAVRRFPLTELADLDQVLARLAEHSSHEGATGVMLDMGITPTAEAAFKVGFLKDRLLQIGFNFIDASTSSTPSLRTSGLMEPHAIYAAQNLADATAKETPRGTALYRKAEIVGVESEAPYGISKDGGVVVAHNQNAKAEFEEAEITDTDGTEIFAKGEITRESTFKELFQKVVGWGEKTGLFSTKHDTPCLGASVEISRGAIRSDMSHGAAEEKTRAIAALPEMLKKAIYVQSETHADKPNLTSHILAARFNLDGIDHVVSMVVREQNGHLFYDHEIVEKAKDDSGSASPPVRTGKGWPESSSVGNVVRNAIGVKPSVNYRQGQQRAPAAPLSAAGIRAALGNAVADVQIVDSEAELPQDARDAIDNDRAAGRLSKDSNGWLGLSLDGKVYLNAPAHGSISEAITTVAHEQVGHIGLRSCFGTDAEFNNFINRVFVSNKAVREYAQKIQKADKVNHKVATEEALAEMAGMAEHRGALQKVVDWIRDAIAKLYASVSGKNLPDATQIRKIISNARRARDGQRTAAGVPVVAGARYSKADTYGAIRRTLPQDEIDGTLMQRITTNVGDAKMMAARALSAMPKTVEDPKGFGVLLHNPETRNGYASIMNRVEHLICDKDATGQRVTVNPMKLRWLPMVASTIEHAQAALRSETGNQVYVRRYSDGTEHMVVVSRDGRLEGQDFGLETHMPKTLGVKAEKYAVLWVNDALYDVVYGAVKETTGEAANQPPSPERGDVSGAGPTSSQGANENIPDSEKGKFRTTTTVAAGAAARVRRR